jgi:ATP-dependent protease ClpP protease subunit
MPELARKDLERARELRSGGIQNFHRSSWYRIENVSTEEATVYVYDEIGYFGVTADDFIRDVSAVHADNLTVRVNSKGGDVFEALAMHAFIAGYNGTVTAIVDSIAASAASYLIAGADKIQIQRNASMMVHDASLTAYGNEEAIRAAADLAGMASDNIADIYAQRTGKPVEEWRAIMKSGDTWYTSEQALEVGLVDEVLDNSKAKTTSGSSESQNNDDDEPLGDLLQGIDLVAILNARS